MNPWWWYPAGFMIQALSGLLDPFVWLGCIPAGLSARTWPAAVFLGMAWVTLVRVFLALMGATRFLSLDALLPGLTGALILTSCVYLLARRFGRAPAEVR